jgi:hypothetical protein
MTGGAHAPTFGPGVLVPSTVLLAILAGVAFMRLRGAPARFLLVALWLRYVLGAYHVFTFKPLVAGFSINALASIGVVAAGLLVVRPQHFGLKVLIPVWLIILAAVLSGVANGDPAGTVNTIIKYAYFAVMLVAAFEVFRDPGGEEQLPWLLAAFAPLLFFQSLSLALDLPKGSELGDGLVYIGGYFHEAVFSVALFTGFLLVALARRVPPLLRIVLLAGFVVGLVFAGYRTTILALGPLALVAFWRELTGWVPASQRAPVATLASVLVLVAAGGAVIGSADKFTDLGTFLSNPGDLIKPPREFTQLDRQVMSGRALIWSRYLYAFDEGAAHQRVFGFGPERWADMFDVYPHNTLIGTLFDFGALGLGAMLLLWATMASLVLRARRGERLLLAAAHLSFVLLNFATMPLWQIEGLALYALLCGYTLFSARAAAGSGSGLRPSRSPGVPPGTRRLPSGIRHNRDSRR